MKSYLSVIQTLFNIFWMVLCVLICEVILTFGIALEFERYSLGGWIFQTLVFGTVILQAILYSAEQQKPAA